MDKQIVKFNDSESLAIEVALYIEKKIKEIRTKGSATFIAIQIEKKTNKVEQIYFGRNESNPLKLGMSEGKIRLSSEGKGDNVKSMLLYNFNLKDFKLHKQKLEFEAYKIIEKEFTDNQWDEWDEHQGCGRGYGRSNDYPPTKNYSKTETKTEKIPLGYAFSKTTKAEELEEETDYELAIEEETEKFSEEAGTIIEEFVNDLKDERQIFMIEPKDYVIAILAEMCKTKEKIERLAGMKIIKGPEEEDKDIPPFNDNAQD